WIALMEFYSSIDRLEDAQKIIDVEVPKLDQAALTRARCYAALYRPNEEKRKVYLALADRGFQQELKEKQNDLAALQSAADFYLIANKLTEAEFYYRVVLGLKAQESVAANRARRMIAVILMAGGNYDQLQEAKSLIAQCRGVIETKANDAEAIEDQRV